MKLLRNTLFLLGIAGAFSCRADYGTAWDTVPKTSKSQRWNNRWISMKEYTHPLGAYVQVPQAATVSVNKNSLSVTYPGCTYEKKLFIFPTEQEARNAGIRYVQTQKKEMARSSRKPGEYGGEQAFDRVVNGLTEGKMGDTIPDPDPLRKYQQNLALISKNEIGFFIVQRCCDEKSDHSQGCRLAAETVGFGSSPPLEP